MKPHATSRLFSRKKRGAGFTRTDSTQAGIPAAIQGYTTENVEVTNFKSSALSPTSGFCHRSVADSDLHQLELIVVNRGRFFVAFGLDRGSRHREVGEIERRPDGESYDKLVIYILRNVG